MDNVVYDFLKSHPTTSRWLEDIVDVIISSAGQAHVKSIARELSKKYNRDINTIEETITRSLNNYCSDAADFKKVEKFDLFKRVEPATYKLRAYPTKPEIIDLITVEFHEPPLNGMWKLFCDVAKKKKPEKWKSLSNREKLEIFIKWISLDKWATEYRRRQGPG